MAISSAFLKVCIIFTFQKASVQCFLMECCLHTQRPYIPESLYDLHVAQRLLCSAFSWSVIYTHRCRTFRPVLWAQSRLTLCDPTDCSQPWGFSRQEYWRGLPCLPLGILPLPDLLHCGQVRYSLSHQGSPRTLRQVAYPFSRGSSRPRNGTRVSYVAGGLFTN